MGIQGFNIGSTNKKKIEAISNDITSGANIVQNIGETVVDEYTLEMGLRKPTDREVIRQYEEDGYEIMNIDGKHWETIGSRNGKEIYDIKIVDIWKPGEEPQKLYFKYNFDNKNYEYLEGEEGERMGKTIEKLEEGLRRGIE